MNGRLSSGPLRPRNDVPKESSLRRWARFGFAALLVLPILWLANYYVQSGKASLPRLSISDWPPVIILAASLTLVMVTNGIILRDLSARFGARLAMREWLGITLVASMLNLVSPVRGGAAVRAVYLKRAHGLTYTRYASLLGSTFVGSIAASGALAAVSIVALGIPGGRFGWIALAISLALAFGPTAVLRFSPTVPGVSKGIVGRLARLAEGWRLVGSDHALVRRIVAWSIVGAVMHAIAFIAAFSLAGSNASWLVPVTASAFARIGALISITPAGLGIFEAFGIVSARIAGSDPGPAVVAVLTVRVFATAISVTGGIAFAQSMLRNGGDGPFGGNSSAHREEHSP